MKTLLITLAVLVTLQVSAQKPMIGCDMDAVKKYLRNYPLEGMIFQDDPQPERPSITYAITRNGFQRFTYFFDRYYHLCDNVYYAFGSESNALGFVQELSANKKVKSIRTNEWIENYVTPQGARVKLFWKRTGPTIICELLD